MLAFQKGQPRPQPASSTPAAPVATPPGAPPAAAPAAQVPYKLEYKFHEWKKGEPPLKLIHKDACFCALVGIHGGLNGAGESAQLTVEADGYCYLSGRATNRILELRAVSVRIVPK